MIQVDTNLFAYIVTYIDVISLKFNVTYCVFKRCAELFVHSACFYGLAAFDPWSWVKLSGYGGERTNWVLILQRCILVVCPVLVPWCTVFLPLLMVYVALLFRYIRSRAGLLRKFTPEMFWIPLGRGGLSSLWKNWSHSLVPASPPARDKIASKKVGRIFIPCSVLCPCLFSGVLFWCSARLNEHKDLMLKAVWDEG